MTTAGMDLAYWIVKAMAEVGYDPNEPTKKIPLREPSGTLAANQTVKGSSEQAPVPCPSGQP